MTKKDCYLQEYESSQQHLHNGVFLQRVIVDEDKLRALFTVCKVPDCGSAIDPTEVDIRYTGAAAHVTATCNSNHTETWDSSSAVGEGHNKRFVINILMVCWGVN